MQSGIIMKIINRKYIAGFFLLASFAFTACGNENANKEEEQFDSASEKVRGDSTVDSTSNQNSNARMSSEVNFVITKNESDENPTSTIELSVNGIISPVSKISGNADFIPNADFKSKEIPENAIAACGGWWAGAGDYFYVVKTDNKLVIYQGWQDEGQNDEGYHWKKMKEIAQ